MSFFWEDSQQHIEKLHDQKQMQPLFQLLNTPSTYIVNQMWKNIDNESTWKKWKTLKNDLNLLEDPNLLPWKQESEHRRIKIKHEPKILRQGYKPSGSFTIKEAYKFHTDKTLIEAEEIWMKIQKSNLCPKISTFLWLIAHGKILTWYNLLK